MNRIFPFSKIAGFLTLALCAFLIALQFIKIEASNILWEALASLKPILWIVFFALLISASNKKSALIAPSWIGIWSYVFYFVSSALSAIAIRIYLTTESFPTTLFTISGCLDFVYVAGTIVTFIWLARYFAKGSLQKFAAIFIPICAVVLFVSQFIFNFLQIDNEATRLIATKIYSVVRVFFSLMPSALFFFAFSKLKK